MTHYLRCIECAAPLTRSGETLVCANGHHYSLVDGCIAVMIRAGANARHFAQQIAYFTNECKEYRGYHVEAWMRKYVDAAMQHFGPPRTGAVALDVGAGSGYITIELARAGWHVIAVDLTPASMVNLVRSARAEGVLDRITPVIGSAMELPLVDACVDAAVGNAIIEHLPDDDRFTAELARACTPGARGMLVAPIALKYVWPWWWLVNFYHDRSIGHLRRYDRAAFTTLLTRHGFVVDGFAYSGHFLKVAGTLLQMLVRTHKYDEWLERWDARGAQRAYGSSNITVRFHKP